MMRQSPSIPQSLDIEAAEARWAAEQLESLIARIGTESVPGMILLQARRELSSLVESVGGEVIGPFRIRVAA